MVAVLGHYIRHSDTRTRLSEGIDMRSPSPAEWMHGDHQITACICTTERKSGTQCRRSLPNHSDNSSNNPVFSSVSCLGVSGGPVMVLDGWACIWAMLLNMGTARSCNWHVLVAQSCLTFTRCWTPPRSPAPGSPLWTSESGCSLQIRGSEPTSNKERTIPCIPSIYKKNLMCSSPPVMRCRCIRLV